MKMEFTDTDVLNFVAQVDQINESNEEAVAAEEKIHQGTLTMRLGELLKED